MKVKQIFIKFYWFGVVLLCAGLIFYGANRYIQIMTERSLLEYEEFREKSIRAAFAIQNHINTEIGSLYQLRDVFRLRGGVLTRSEFGMISGAILSRYDGIQALEWIPWVPHSKRELYEQKAIDEGLKDFGFKAILDDGRVGLSPVQEDYYPVYYIEPLAGNEKAAGLNLASSKPRREALLKSIRTNKAVASEGIRLIQEKKGQNVVLVFLPIDSESDPSLLLGVFRINDMISSTFSNGVHPDLKIYIYDLNDSNNLYPLASLGEKSGVDLPTIEVLTDKNGLISVSTIDVADRQWALVVKPVQSIKYNRYQSIAWTVSFLLVAIMLLAVTSVYLRRRHIHTRREAHVRYQTLTQKLQAILDNTIDGIITIDSKGIIQSVNKAGLSMFGYSNDEMIGHNVSMITPEAIKMEHDSYIKNYLDGIPPKIIGIGRDVEGVRKDGSKIPLRLGVSQARVNGEIVFIGLLHDISERKNNEKMKDEFISTVNHELRTPLTSILGSIQLIRKVASEQVDESVRKLLKISENNTHRIIKIVNDILDLQKISSGGMYFDFLKIDLVSLTRRPTFSVLAKK